MGQLGGMWEQMLNCVLILSLRVNLRGGTQLRSAVVWQRRDGIMRRTRHSFVFQGTIFMDDRPHVTVHQFLHTLVTQPWHPSACCHPPLEDVAISGIQLDILFLPSPPTLLSLVNQRAKANFTSPYIFSEFLPQTRVVLYSTPYDSESGKYGEMNLKKLTCFCIFFWNCTVLQ